MGTKERRDREREEIQTKILDAARELFASEGYEATTMRRIAERIEYSPTAIYFHFRDKEAILRAICDADFLALAVRFRDIAQISDPIDRLKATGFAYAEFGLTHPNHYRLMFMTPHPQHGPDDSTLEHGNPEEDAYAFLKATIAAGLAQGRFRRELSDLELLSQTVWAGVHGVVSLRIAKCNDAWVDWSAESAAVALMIDSMVRGLTTATEE